ncbi:hypothetical protein HMPREF9996_00255, partial [Aggregatibacter actinomycetemcomitans Y4]
MKKKNIWQYNKDNQSNEPVSLLFIASEQKSAVGILGVFHLNIFLSANHP